MIRYTIFLLVLFVQIMHSAAKGGSEFIIAKSTVGTLGGGMLIEVFPATSIDGEGAFDGSALVHITKEAAASTLSCRMRREKTKPNSPLRNVKTHEAQVLVAQVDAEKTFNPDEPNSLRNEQ